MKRLPMKNPNTLSIYSDLIARASVNTLPGWAIKKISNCVLKDANVKLVFDDSLMNECQIYYGDLITASKVLSMPKLEWIHFASTGINRALIAEVVNSNIVVTNTPYAFTDSLVHLCMSYMFALSQGLYAINALHREGNLSRETFEPFANSLTTLKSQSCLIVGCGRIGMVLAEQLNSFGMNISAIKRGSHYSKIPTILNKVYNLGELTKIAGQFRFIVNLLPLTASTKKVFNKEVFESMSSDSFFINVGRGKTVDEDSLVYALKNNHIAAAALDVFEEEPLCSSSELYNIDNLLITPHIGNLNGSHWESSINLFLKNLVNFSEDRELDYVVDLDKGY